MAFVARGGATPPAGDVWAFSWRAPLRRAFRGLLASATSQEPEGTEAEGGGGGRARYGRIDLEKGEMLIVPRNVEHRPRAEKECSALVIESAGTVNTGDAGGELTIKKLESI